MALSRGFVQNAATTPVDARLMDAAKVTRNLDGSIRTGVLWTGSTSGVIIAGQSTMQIGLFPADFVVSRTDDDGAVILSNRGTSYLTLPAAPSANSRYDLIWVKQNDSTQGDADSQPVFGVTSGTAAASPTVPTAPTGARIIGNVLVPAGVTNTNAAGVVITHTFRWTALSGSPVRYRSLSSLTSEAPTLQDGTFVYLQVANVATNFGIILGGVVRRLDADALAVMTLGGSLTSSATVGAQLTATAGSVPDGNYFSYSSTGYAITVLQTGYYDIAATLQWAANTTGQRYVTVWANNAEISPRIADRRSVSGTTGTAEASIGRVVLLNAGDVITLRANQDSGSTLAYSGQLSIRLSRTS